MRCPCCNGLGRDEPSAAMLLCLTVAGSQHVSVWPHHCPATAALPNSSPAQLLLCEQDIAGGLEGQLAAPMLDRRPAASGPGEPAFALPPAAAVWRGLRRCLEPDVFLQQVGKPWTLHCSGRWGCGVGSTNLLLQPTRDACSLSVLPFMGSFLADFLAIHTTV